MPNITAAGTYTKNSAGFELLEATFKKRIIMWGATSVGNSITFKWVDDQGTARGLQGLESLTDNAGDIEVDMGCDLQIVDGTPTDLNVSIYRAD